MKPSPEFAEEYTKVERLRFVALGVVGGTAVVLASKFWLLPWLRAFAASAPCRKVMGIDGVTFLWHALFIGIPLFAGAVVGLTMGRHGYRVLRDGQTPPRGAKVFIPTLVKRGAGARLSGYAHLLAFVPFLLLAIWGRDQAAGLSAQPRDAQQVVRCMAKPSVEQVSVRAIAAGGQRG
jgi:hypothetical protein